MKRFVVLLAAMTLAVSCNNASTDNKTAEAVFDPAAARSSVEASNVKFVENFKKGDSAGVAGLYTTDALILPPNMETVSAGGITAFWGGFIRMGVKDLKLITGEVEGNREQLVEVGKYEVYGDQNQLFDKGKYIVTWKAVNGEWKMHRDIFNSDIPPAAGK